MNKQPGPLEEQQHQEDNVGGIQKKTEKNHQEDTSPGSPQEDEAFQLDENNKRDQQNNDTLGNP